MRLQSICLAARVEHPPSDGASDGGGIGTRIGTAAQADLDLGTS